MSQVGRRLLSLKLGTDSFSMEKILQEINLGTLVQRFTDERIDSEAVIALTDQNLVRLGVQTIGDRVRLRTFCIKKSQRPKIL